MTGHVDEQIDGALELAAGSRLKGGYGQRQTPTQQDVAHVRRAVSLFLECLDPELTVSELLAHML